MPCPSRSPILKGKLLKSGAHVNAVGGCAPQFVEVDVDCLRRAKLYCDSLTSCLNEPGEIVNPGRGFSKSKLPLKFVINLEARLLQSNPLNGSPDNGSIRLLVQVLVSPKSVLS